MYSRVTMAYSIQLQTTLTDICGVQKQEKSIRTSNKKHFIKTVKECRDVNPQKVSEQGWDAIGTQHTPFGPHSALTIRTMLWVQSVCDV